MRAMTRVKVPIFTPADIDFLQEYVSVMGPVATALDKLQGESQAYLSCLLPIIAITNLNLKKIQEEKYLAYCMPLVNTLIAGIEKRFGHLLSDQEFQLAAAFHPRFRLLWLEKCRPTMVDSVRLMMETVLEQGLKDEQESLASASEESTEETEGDDFFAAITQPSRASSSGSARSLKIKAQSLLVTWLDGSSKNDLSAATFLGEPAIIKLFVKYNTTIPSSAAVEHLFSIGKEILRARRCMLTDSTFEKLMFMKGNMRYMGSLEELRKKTAK